MVFHCKPCYKYQSIEFDFDTKDGSMEDMKEIYCQCLDILVAIAPEQETSPRPRLPKAPAEPKQELASTKQLDYMDSLGIKHPAKCTKALATKLIQDHVGQKSLFNEGE